MMNSQKDSPASAEASPEKLVARIPSEVESALSEFARQAILKSVDNSLDFHKTMLQISATFGTLITTLVPLLIWGDKNYEIPAAQRWFLIAPSALMLLSAVVFALGYYPSRKRVRANVLEEVKKARREVIAVRFYLASVGMTLFIGAILLLLFLAFGLGIETSG